MNTKVKDIDESKRVKELVMSKAKQCYVNAARVVMGVAEYADAEYVEGLAVIEKVFVIEHGWIEKDGVIIDPTLPDKPLDYFPGLRFKGLRGVAEALKVPKPERTSEDFPIFFRFGWGGIDSPEFRSALVEAYRYAGVEDLAKWYENYKPKDSSEALSA